MCGKGSNSTTQTQSSTTSANPAAMAQYNWLLGQGRNLVENTGWNPNTAQQVAGFSNDQSQAFANIRGGIARPYIDAASGMVTTGAGPVSQTMQQYYNPWNHDVVDATIRDFGVQNDRQMSGVTGNARMAGSLGGDREAVAKALTAEAQSRTQSPVLANLRAQGFNTAIGAAQNDAARSLQGAGIMGNLGNLAYTDTQALLSSGALQQALEQQRLDAASGNASAESAYPFQSLGWFANLASGIGSQMGSTTTSTGTKQGPTPNTWSQLAGLGIAALPYLNTGGRVAYAGGGGIGYIPQIQIQRGAGVQPHQQMQMGGGESQKGLADHWKDVTDTAKAGSQAFKGLSKVGEAMRTEQAPNGWGSVTTTYADPMANMSYGLSNTMSGIGSALGFADGGAVRDDLDPSHRNPYDGLYYGPAAVGPLPPPYQTRMLTDDGNDPGGIYDAAPGGAGLVPPPRPVVFPDVSQYPPLMQQGTSVGIAGAQPPSDLAPMVDVTDKAMLPTAGEAYAPPADIRVGALNPSGIVAPPSAPTASAALQPQGFFDRAINWIRSPEGEQTLTRAGMAMMAASGEGGKGTTGIHFGKGMMAGLDARDSYRKGEREQALQRAKMDLAQRAAAIQDEQNQRQAAMHPYEVALKKAQAEAQRAAIDGSKIIQVDPAKLLWDSKTKQWITPPGGTGSQTQAIFDKKFAEKAPEMYEKAAAAYADADGMAMSVRELGALAPYAETGFGQEQILTLRKLGARFGLDVSEKIAPTELFRALSQNFVLQAAQKLKPLSNSDVTFVQRGLATIESDPSTLKSLLPGMEAVARRQALAEKLKMDALKSGRPPDYVAILQEVDRQIPSPILDRFGRGIASGSPSATASAPPSGGVAPRASSSAAAPSETERQRLLAIPDGLVVYKGKPYIKQGARLVPAPEDAYTRSGISGNVYDRSKGVGVLAPTYP